MGPKLAGALADAAISAPEHVSAVALQRLPKVGRQRAERLMSAFIAAAPEYAACQLLVPAGLPARLGSRVVDTFGPSASRLLREDPWQLLQLSGVSLPEADRLARTAIPGVSRDDPRRARALVWHALAEQAREGHTVTARRLVIDALNADGVVAAQDAIADALRVGTIAVATTEDTAESGTGDGADGVALARYAAAEDSIAVDVARLTSAAKPMPITAKHPALVALDDTQRHAVTEVFRAGFSVLTGGPGTGKSRTVAAVVAVAESAGISVALAAPTGRAAKRLEELCEAPASTLHRLLGAQPRSGGDGLDYSAGFQHGHDLPLSERLVVVDETSMLDAELAASLLAACADGTHVLFVGDPAQLPSIGAGRVLADIIDAAVVPVTELRTLYRQNEGGAIARLATHVREGELVAVDDETREVVVVATRGSDDAARRVVQLVTDSIPRALGIASDQIQVVTPVHRGPAGTQALNQALKSRLNPGTGRRRFDPGDRVVATANHIDAEPNGYANGEVGVVSEVGEDGALTVVFASGPAVVKGKALADLLHGWAITVHRAQGSEFAAVVVVLTPEAGRMLSRPLVYTAFTRAQHHLSVVHGVGPALAHAVRKVGAAPRRTQLSALLHAAMPAQPPK